MGPAQAKWRTYHSTALLLPDGRVLSAGDDYWDVGDLPDPWADDGQPADEAEIYSPPYLFDGNDPAPRPAIGSAPAAIRYGDELGVAIAARAAARAVLVAPGAVTHGNDMNQRHVELAVTGAVPGKGINVRAPADPSLAPPGHYMLFVFDAQGTPSVARWVRLGADAADAPVLTPDPEPTPAPSPTPTPGAPAPAPAPAPDTAVRDGRAPRLALRWTQLRRTSRRLRIRVRSNERARARVSVRIQKRLVRRTVRLRARRFATLRIRLPRRTAARVRAGRRIAVAVTVDARDAAGNRRRIKRSRRLP